MTVINNHCTNNFEVIYPTLLYFKWHQFFYFILPLSDKQDLKPKFRFQFSQKNKKLRK